MNKEDAKIKILDLIVKAEMLTPNSIEKDLAAIADDIDVPGWHDYELQIWEIGEEIRLLISDHVDLKKDDEINNRIIELCLNQDAKRGRQSFILLLGFQHNRRYASKLIHLINDKYVYGHIIEVIYKMKATGYIKEIQPFLKDNKTWIKKRARQYIEKYGTQHGA